MRELPVLMNGFGVRATLARTKTMTRRPIRDVCPWVTKIEHVGGDDYPWLLSDGGDRYAGYDRNPLGIPGDLLYVRETTQKWGEQYGQYRATHTAVIGPAGRWPEYPMASRRRALWWYSRDVCPSIHMPKWATRLWLLNTGVRVERGPEISEADARAEGFESADAFKAWWANQYPGLDWRFVTEYEVIER